MTRHGYVHWNELMTRDPDGMKAFYQRCLGWEFKAMLAVAGAPPYWVAHATDGTAVGGIFDMRAADFDGVPEMWIPYIAVSDVDMAVETAQAAGAALLRGVMDIDGIGRIAILREPGGATVGWMTPASTVPGS